jgi:hypothetical protein
MAFKILGRSNGRDEAMHRSGHVGIASMLFNDAEVVPSAPPGAACQIDGWAYPPKVKVQVTGRNGILHHRTPGELKAVAQRIIGKRKAVVTAAGPLAVVMARGMAPDAFCQLVNNTAGDGAAIWAFAEANMATPEGAAGLVRDIYYSALSRLMRPAEWERIVKLADLFRSHPDLDTFEALETLRAA